MSTQTTLFGDDAVETPSQFEREWGISEAEFRKRQNTPAEATKPEERECPECGNRVTQTKNGPEVGHKIGQRPDEEMCPLHFNAGGDARQQAFKWEGR